MDTLVLLMVFLVLNDGLELNVDYATMVTLVLIMASLVPTPTRRCKRWLLFGDIGTGPRDRELGPNSCMGIARYFNTF
jgi:hypothetical protein